jgi:NifB/MoaA-like Fe-S oxidoreductase
VSIHSTDPELRSTMLRNRRGATSLRWLRALLDHGIEVRGQIVVCPGVNDGTRLDDTLAGILDEYPELSTVAVVPLGISQFNPEPGLRVHTADEANAVIDAVEDWQDVYLAALGRRLVHAADEYYLMGGRAFPAVDRYEGFPMHEDGVGMARTFEGEFHGRVEGATGTKRGFFASVDTPRNPTDYRTPCSTEAPGGAPVILAPRRSAPIGILSGELGTKVLRPLVASLDRPDVRVIPVVNEFFGGNTGVSGLMVGADLSRVLAEEPAGHRYLLPDVCLSDDGRFLDGGSVAGLPRPVEIIATDGRALRDALGERSNRGR